MCGSSALLCTHQLCKMHLCDEIEEERRSFWQNNLKVSASSSRITGTRTATRACWVESQNGKLLWCFSSSLPASMAKHTRADGNECSNININTAIPRLVRSPKSANSISASLGLLVRVPVPFTTYILPRLVRIRLVRMPFFWNALLALTEELLYQ